MAKDTATPIDLQEHARLQALEAYQIVDTPAEKAFDDLTALAAHVCDTPISLITLLTCDRQWFKSRKGVDLAETPRSISFCQYAIEQEACFEIPDTLQDERFCHNPIVTGHPHIRFYAGATLLSTNGQKLGTLCVMDTVPRHLTAAQKAALQTLAKQVITHFELRLKQKQLEQEKAQLQQANQKLDEFVHMVSHDLKEPLMNMHTVTEWLQEDLITRDYTNMTDNLHMLQERATAMLELVEGLLQYASCQVGHLPKETVSVALLLQNLVAATRNAQGFSIHIAPDMPELQTEKILLQQVFANLLSNAIKYHHTGKGHIWFAVQDHAQHYTFSVQDDGPGIAPEHHHKIFGLYERLLRDANTSGSGIGLATVKRIVEDKGARIWVDSEPGQGATFRFTWPK